MHIRGSLHPVPGLQITPTPYQNLYQSSNIVSNSGANIRFKLIHAQGITSPDRLTLSITRNLTNEFYILSKRRYLNLSSRYLLNHRILLLFIITNIRDLLTHTRRLLLYSTRALPRNLVITLTHRANLLPLLRRITGYHHHTLPVNKIYRYLNLLNRHILHNRHYNTLAILLITIRLTHLIRKPSHHPRALP